MALYFNNLRGLKTRLHLHAIITVKEKEKEKKEKKRIYRRMYIGFVNLSMAQCVNSVQKYGPEITPYLDTFHTVAITTDDISS